MTSPPRTTGNASRRRRKLNQPLIKSVIVLFASAITAVGSAATGIGAHLAFAPMLTWMFGYSPEKAQGTALRFSFAAIVATGITYFALHGQPLPHLGRGLLLVIGATLGALAAAPVTPKPTATGVRRALHGIAILVALFTVTEATHLTAVTRTEAHLAQWSSWWQLLLLGLVAGALTQAARLTGGTLLVPALFFLTAVPDRISATGIRPLTASEAVIDALIVVLYASLLPAWGYAQRRLVDSTYLTPAIFGGVAGGALGGWLLTQLAERSILILFGIVAMFFAAREIYRLATDPPPTLQVAEPQSENPGAPEP